LEEESELMLERKQVKRALAEAWDFGRFVGIGFEYEGDKERETFCLSFDTAEELMEALWRAGCRPRAVERELGAIKSLMFGWKHAGIVSSD
jgi:hypothetical protein